MKTILLLLLSLLLCLSSFAQAEKYAVMVSSGYVPDANYMSFSVEAREMWLNLQDNGYKKENIYLLDGSDVMNDIPYYAQYECPTIASRYAEPFWERADRDAMFFIGSMESPLFYTNPQYVYDVKYSVTPKDWDRDGICDIYAGALAANFYSVCDTLSSVVTEQDELFVYFVDHGNNYPENGGFIYGFWAGDWIVYPADEQQFPDFLLPEQIGNGDLINAALAQIPYSKRIIYTSTCHAGAIKNHITGDNTIFVCQTDEDNYGYTTVPTYYVTAPSEMEIPDQTMHWGDSFNICWANSLVSRASDLDRDGKISWQEAFDYTYVNEKYSPLSGSEYVEYPILFDDDNIAETTYVVEALVGDVNMDGKINMLDKVIVYNNLGLTDATWWDGDLNNDEIVTQEDLDLVIENWDPSLVGIDWLTSQSNFYDGPVIGDIDGDNFVGGDDLNIVLANWGTSSALELLPGDINYDGFVGGEDLNLVLANWGKGVNPSVLVPEPSVCILIGIGFASFVCKRKKNR